MALTQEQFRDAAVGDLGDELAALLDDADIDRWVNIGKDLLGPRVGKRADLTWAALDRSVNLPADFIKIARVKPQADVVMPAWQIHGLVMWFEAPEGASEAGTADIFYWALYPDITSSVPSTLLRNEETAVVSYVLHRFYRKIASSRALFRRYSVITGQNGVDVEDLQAIAREHLLDFEEGAKDTEQPEPVSYYGE
jgi:hypothetical protein